MLPALRGRLVNDIQLAPLKDEVDAVKLWKFYLQQARDEADHFAQDKGWNRGADVPINEPEAKAVFDELLKKERTIQGVRQRDYLNTLYNLALPYLK